MASTTVTFMEAGDPPRPVATLVGVIGGQQQDDDFSGVTHTRIRRTGSSAGGANTAENAVPPCRRYHIEVS